MLSKLFNLATISLFSSIVNAAQDPIKLMYIFKSPATSNNEAIKTTGYNALSFFGINLKSNGDIVWALSALDGSPDVTLAQNGVYTGGSNYSTLVKAYKTGNTNINRLEVTLGNYANIRSSIAANGTGAQTTLYKNLAALKEAWNLDAITNDDESEYDAASTIAFAGMLGQIGYKYTAAPYTNIDYWSSVVSQINGKTPGLFDRAYLQCYDGGAGNVPSQWVDALKIDVIPLLWVTNDAKPYDGMTPMQCQGTFQGYEAGSGGKLAGGGYWNNYDIEKQGSSYSAYADVLRKVFG